MSQKGSNPLALQLVVEHLRVAARRRPVVVVAVVRADVEAPQRVPPLRMWPSCFAN
jgi:hypothetical protein